MNTALKIFIASSNEGKKYAQDIQQLLYEEGGDSVEVFGWWNDESFPPGRTYIESLTSIIKRTNASLILVTEDDIQTQRGTVSMAPRDNCIFECGMCVSAHGRDLCSLAVIGNSKLPSDLKGVNYSPIIVDPDHFLEKNRGTIRKVVKHWQKALSESQYKLETQLPRLYETVLRVLTSLRGKTPSITGSVDVAAAELIESIADAFSSDKDMISEKVVSGVAQVQLANCESIYAVDVLGPLAWITPTSFRYLAIQIREYIRANVRDETWNLIVSSDIEEAIRRAVDNSKSWRVNGRPVLRESLTEFDNPEDFRWEKGSPRLEFSRILIWTEDEMKSSIAESVIAIHESFHIPLFCIIVDKSDPLREFDYILFKGMGDKTSGFYNLPTEGFRLGVIRNGRIPGYTHCLTHWNTLLNDPRLAFAIDARHALRRGLQLASPPSGETP